MRIGLIAVGIAGSIGAAVALAAPQEEDFHGASPGEHHKHLQAFAGEWEFTGWAQFGPERTEVKGTKSARMDLNGLWLIFDLKADMGGAPFSGHGFMGYESSKRKYVGCWVDSEGDRLHLSEGECDGKGKVFTSIMTEQDPESGAEHKIKDVSELVDKDTRTMKFYMMRGDEEELSMELTYKRKK